MRTHVWQSRKRVLFRCSRDYITHDRWNVLLFSSWSHTVRLAYFLHNIQLSFVYINTHFIHIQNNAVLRKNYYVAPPLLLNLHNRFVCDYMMHAFHQLFFPGLVCLSRDTGTGEHWCEVNMTWFSAHAIFSRGVVLVSVFAICNKDCHSHIGIFSHKRRCYNPATNKHKLNTNKKLGCIMHGPRVSPYHEKRRQGRPARRWRDDLDQYCSDTIRQKTAEDRVTWRRHAEAFAQPRDTTAAYLCCR